MKFTMDNFYHTKRWEHLVEHLKVVRANDKGELICPECGKPIVKKYDCIGHHVIELNEQNVNDPSISLNPDNVRLIHFKCHNTLHHRFGYRQCVYLVYGPPRAGKNTWVWENATKNDLILDIDRIWQMLTVNPEHIKPNALRTPVFQIREQIYKLIKTRTGKWQNAYIIGGFPFVSERERICSETGAREVFIYETKAVCLERAAKKNPELLYKYTGYIEDWFTNYQESEEVSPPFGPG